MFRICAAVPLCTRIYCSFLCYWNSVEVSFCFQNAVHKYLHRKVMRYALKPDRWGHSKPGWFIRLVIRVSQGNTRIQVITHVSLILKSFTSLVTTESVTEHKIYFHWGHRCEAKYVGLNKPTMSRSATGLSRKRRATSPPQTKRWSSARFCLYC